MDLEDLREKVVDIIITPKFWLKSGIRRSQRLWAWLPIIWRDEDWDEAYLCEIMAFKISRIRKDMERLKCHVHWERDVRNMKIAEELLKRFTPSSSFYWDDDQLHKKDFCSCPEQKVTYTDSSYGKNYREMHFHYCRWCQLKSSRERADKKEKEDWEFLWKHISKQAKRWWT